MVEILANNLKPFFKNTRIKGNCTYKGKDFEVWEVKDEDFDIMCSLTEERFAAYCPNGWWRSSNGSVLGYPNEIMLVNGEELKCWDRKEDSFYGVCISVGNNMRKYKNLSDYLCNCVGTSQPGNVCACAMDLAKYNNMTMGELFTKYEG